MAHTDKDDPEWVKAVEHLDEFEPWHHWACVENIRHEGQDECDLPPSPPLEQFHTRSTYCGWTFTPDDRSLYEEVMGGWPSHGCNHPRCTNCTQKKTQKRRDRNEGKRQLRQLVEEELGVKL